MIYPIFLTLLNKRTIKRGKPDASSGDKYSLLFCAYNEIEVMRKKIDNIKELIGRHQDLEVLVFDYGSIDGTAELIEQEAPFVTLVRGYGRNGKAYGMKKLVSLSRCEFLVFTDANVILSVDSIDRLAACYSDNEVGGVCGALHYLGAEKSATAEVGGLYWRLEEKIKDIESATGSVMGADGSIFSIRKNLYPEFPDTVLDDFTVSMEVVFKSKRLIKSNDVQAFEHLVQTRTDEFRRKIRIATRAYHTHQYLNNKRRGMSRLNRYKYFSHKILRWFGAVFLFLGYLFGLITTYLISMKLSIVVLLITVFGVFVGLKQSKGIFSSIIDIVVAMIATMIGIYNAKRGITYSTWTPAKSRS